MTTPACKIRYHGRGTDTWAECDCGIWAWIGTYFMGGAMKRRAEALRLWEREHRQLNEQLERGQTNR